MADDLGKKISELPETTDLQGLYTIGTDKNTSSKKVSLEFLRQAADYANAQGDYAKSVGDTVAGNVGATDYPVFSASGVYAIGDVVRYADRLYRFTAPHQAGAWNGADVELTSINEEAQRKVSELKQETDQKLTELESATNAQLTELSENSAQAIGGIYKLTIADYMYSESGKSVDKKGNIIEDSANFRIAKVPVTKGDVVKATCAGYNTHIIAEYPNGAEPSSATLIGGVITENRVVKEYTYQCQESGYVLICWAVTYGALETIYIQTIGKLVQQIDGAEKRIEEIYENIIEFNNTNEFVPTTTYSIGRIVADTSFSFQKGDMLKSVAIVSNGTSRSTQVIARIYNNNNEEVSNIPLGTIGTETRMVDVSHHRIVLDEGYKVAIDGALTYQNMASSKRFYDFASKSYVENYFYGLAVEVTRLSLMYLNEEIDTLNEEIDTLNEEIDTLNEEIDTLNEEIDTLNEEIDTLNDGLLKDLTIGECVMSNPKVDVMSRNTLRVLEIGNSYTSNPVRYFSQIVSNAQQRGVLGNLNDFVYSYLIRSSGSFKTWVDCYNDIDNKTYQYNVVVGNRSLVVPDNWVGGDANNGSLFRQVITDNKWDIIIIHQASSYANDPTQWEGNGNGGYLPSLLKILRKHQPQAEIGFTLVHSYAANYSGNTEGSALARWKNICKGVRWMQQRYGVDFVIPYGTAIQNLRLLYPSVVGELTEDLTHPAYGLASYTSSLCWFDALVGRRYGVPFEGDTWSYDGSADRANSQYPNSIIDVNATTREQAKLCARNAIVAMYTNS